MEYRRKRLLMNIARDAGFISVGAILVVGFYYHSMFYELGLPVLVIAGALVVVLIIKLVQWLSGTSMIPDVEGFLIFRPEDVEPIKTGIRKQTIRLDRPDSGYTVGGTYAAKVALMSERAFAFVRLTKIETWSLSDVTEEMARREGFAGLDEFRSAWKRRHGRWDPGANVVILRFKTEVVV